MDFRLSPAQKELQERARRLLDDQFSPGLVREAEASADGFPRTVWDAGVRLGWSAMPLAEEFGGGAAGLLDVCVLLEEIGRNAAALPLVVSSGVCGTMLQAAPAGAQRALLLEAIASGSIVAPALIDESERNEWDGGQLTLRPDGGDYRLSGTKILVPFASAADELLVTSASPDGTMAIVAVDVSTDAVAEGVAITPHHSKIGVPLASVEFTDAPICADRMIHQGDGAHAAVQAGLQIGSLLTTAEAVGMCEALIAMTADHVTRRQAFGRPIGTFQAVAHPCADMRVSADAIRILVQQAAWLIDNGEAADEEVPATKALANEHFERIANDAYRLHGALGFSTECDVQLYTRRLHGFFGSFGETQESYERAAAALGM